MPAEEVFVFISRSFYRIMMVVLKNGDVAQATAGSWPPLVPKGEAAFPRWIVLNSYNLRGYRSRGRV
jgi:hypothetical protein